MILPNTTRSWTEKTTEYQYWYSAMGNRHVNTRTVIMYHYRAKCDSNTLPSPIGSSGDLVSQRLIPDGNEWYTYEETRKSEVEWV